MARKPVKIYPRGNYYYYQILKDDGTYGIQHSTHVHKSMSIKIAEQKVMEIIARGDHQKISEKGISKSVVARQIRRYLQSHNVIEKGKEIDVDSLLDALSLNLHGVSLKKENPFFVEYLLKFWTWDESDFIQDKINGGFNPGETHVDDYLSKVKNHVVPFFDPVLRIKNITTGMLEDFRRHLQSKKALPSGKYKNNISEQERSLLSSGTILEILQAVKQPLREAKRLGMITVNPADAMTKIVKKKAKKGILTSSEVEKLFVAKWRTEKTRLANLTASVTGLRAGEIGAFWEDDLYTKNGKGYIDISRSFERVKKKIKSTKSGKPRYVRVPIFLINDLLALHKTSPYKGSNFIFWGQFSDRPMRLGTFLEDFRLAMLGIGISLEEQKERNITFHSWRHYLNSTLRGSVPDEMLQKWIGHESKEMTDLYDQLTEEQMDEIYTQVEIKVLPFVKKAS